MPLSQAELTIAIVYCMVLQNIKSTNCNVFNTCARLICNESKYCHITPLLMELHWLPINLRIESKIVLIVFKIFKGFALSYLSSLITRMSRWASEDHIHTNINSTWRILFSTCLSVCLHVFSGIPRGILCYLNLAE